jgi:hypothetical protein
VLDTWCSEIDELEANVQPTWAGLVDPIEWIVDRLGTVWGSISHLKATSAFHYANISALEAANASIAHSNPCSKFIHSWNTAYIPVKQEVIAHISSCVSFCGEAISRGEEIL